MYDGLLGGSPTNGLQDVRSCSKPWKMKEKLPTSNQNICISVFFFPIIVLIMALRWGSIFEPWNQDLYEPTINFHVSRIFSLFSHMLVEKKSRSLWSWTNAETFRRCGVCLGGQWIEPLGWPGNQEKGIFPSFPLGSLEIGRGPKRWYHFPTLDFQVGFWLAQVRIFLKTERFLVKAGNFSQKRKSPQNSSFQGQAACCYSQAPWIFAGMSLSTGKWFLCNEICPSKKCIGPLPNGPPKVSC